MWKEARALEIKQLFEYEMFESKGKGAPIPDGYERIKVKIIYDCKHDYRRKARCVARGDLTSDADPETTYSSVVSLKSLRTVMFIGETEWNANVCW